MEKENTAIVAFKQALNSIGFHIEWFNMKKIEAAQKQDYETTTYWRDIEKDAILKLKKLIENKNEE